MVPDYQLNMRGLCEDMQRRQSENERMERCGGEKVLMNILLGHVCDRNCQQLDAETKRMWLAEYLGHLTKKNLKFSEQSF